MNDLNKAQTYNNSRRLTFDLVVPNDRSRRLKNNKPRLDFNVGLRNFSFI